MSKKSHHHYEDAYIFVPDEEEPDCYRRIPLYPHKSEDNHHNHHRYNDDDDSEELGFPGFIVVLVGALLLALVV